MHNGLKEKSPNLAQATKLSRKLADKKAIRYIWENIRHSKCRKNYFYLDDKPERP